MAPSASTDRSDDGPVDGNLRQKQAAAFQVSPDIHLHHKLVGLREVRRVGGLRARESGRVRDVNALRRDRGDPAKPRMQVLHSNLPADRRGGTRVNERNEPIPGPEQDEEKRDDDNDGEDARPQYERRRYQFGCWRFSIIMIQFTTGTCGCITTSGYESEPRYKFRGVVPSCRRRVEHLSRWTKSTAPSCSASGAVI